VKINWIDYVTGIDALKILSACANVSLNVEDLLTWSIEELDNNNMIWM